MLKDKAYEYFITKDHNCAETVLLAISEEYGLAGSMAALGKMAVNGRAHATEDFGPLCAGLFEAFKAKLGSVKCSELKEMYRNDEVRCLKTVELGLEVFEAYAKEKGLVPAKE